MDRPSRHASALESAPLRTLSPALRRLSARRRQKCSATPTASSKTAPEEKCDARASGKLNTAPEEKCDASGKLNTAPEVQCDANGKLKTVPEEKCDANGKLKTAPEEKCDANSKLNTAPEVQRDANGKLKTAPKVQCDANGKLKGATYSDHSAVIIGLLGAAPVLNTPGPSEPTPGRVTTVGHHCALWEVREPFTFQARALAR